MDPLTVQVEYGDVYRLIDEFPISEMAVTQALLVYERLIPIPWWKRPISDILCGTVSREENLDRCYHFSSDFLQLHPDLVDTSSLDTNTKKVQYIFYQVLRLKTTDFLNGSIQTTITEHQGLVHKRGFHELPGDGDDDDEDEEIPSPDTRFVVDPLILAHTWI